MSTNFTHDLYCVKCNHLLDAATSISDGEHAIIPGDSISICLYCGAVMVYVMQDDQLALRSITDEEMEDMAKNQPAEYTQIKRAVTLAKIKNVPNFILPKTDNN